MSIRSSPRPQFLANSTNIVNSINQCLRTRGMPACGSLGVSTATIPRGKRSDLGEEVGRLIPAMRRPARSDVLEWTPEWATPRGERPDERARDITRLTGTMLEHSCGVFASLRRRHPPREPLVSYWGRFQ